MTQGRGRGGDHGRHEEAGQIVHRRLETRRRTDIVSDLGAWHPPVPNRLVRGHVSNNPAAQGNHTRRSHLRFPWGDRIGNHTHPTASDSYLAIYSHRYITIRAEMSGTSDTITNRMLDFRRLAVGYVRVSTAGQGTSGISLDAQKVGIETFADAMGYTLVEVFEDVASGVGAKSFHKRDGLNAALDLAARADADLIVWDWDRLSRHTGFANQVRKVLPDSDRIVCAKEGTMMRDAARAASFEHGERIAQEISRTTKKGMARLGAEGVTFGNPLIRTYVQPLGAATWSNSAYEHVCRIADVLRELDDPFGVTHAHVAKILNEKGLRTLQSKEWTASRARIPLSKARELLRSEGEYALRSLPTFGMV